MERVGNFMPECTIKYLAFYRTIDGFTNDFSFSGKLLYHSLNWSAVGEELCLKYRFIRRVTT